MTICEHCAQLSSHVQLFVAPWTLAHQALLSNFPGKNSGVECHVLLQGIFLTQESNPHLLSPALIDGFLPLVLVKMHIKRIITMSPEYWIFKIMKLRCLFFFLISSIIFMFDFFFFFSPSKLYILISPLHLWKNSSELSEKLGYGPQ